MRVCINGRVAYNAILNMSSYFMLVSDGMFTRRASGYATCAALRRIVFVALFLVAIPLL